MEQKPPSQQSIETNKPLRRSPKDQVKSVNLHKTTTPTTTTVRPPTITITSTQQATTTRHQLTMARLHTPTTVRLVATYLTAATPTTGRPTTTTAPPATIAVVTTTVLAIRDTARRPPRRGTRLLRRVTQGTRVRGIRISTHSRDTGRHIISRRYLAILLLLPLLLPNHC